ncbi:MAG: hypothetical protein ACYCX2_10560 [Christensenellales bacterium]
MKPSKPKVLFFSALTILFLVLAPPYLEDGVTQNIYKQWMAIKQSSWAGVAKLWDIKGWETGKGSAAQWLKSAAVTYERSIPGMYIEVVGMTIDEAQQRMQNGEYPDLYSFPLGFMPQGDLCEISAPENMQEKALQAGQYGQRQLALPYMLGSYALIVNKSMFYERQLLLPSDEEWTPEALKEAAARLPDGLPALGYDEERYTLPGAAILSYAGENITSGKPVMTENATDAFFKHELGMLIGTQKAVATLKDSAAGLGPDAEMLSLGGYTDMVQFIAVRRDDNQTKNECCIAFARFLCSGRQQHRLEGLHVFPAVRMEAYLDNDFMVQLNEGLQNAMVPNCFTWDSVRVSLKEAVFQGIIGNCNKGQALLELAKALS